MNKLTIIGNLVRSPEQRATQSGIAVTTFTVAVNRRRTQEGQPETDFFRVTAWRGLAETCGKYLDKGRKVCVVGPVSISTYTGNDGQTRASMEVTAEDVEFLTSKNNEQPESKDVYQVKKERNAEAAYIEAERKAIQNEGKNYVEYVPVSGDDELPF